MVRKSTKTLKFIHARRFKEIPVDWIRLYDLTITMDASGGQFFKFIPTFSAFTSEEAQRHQLLKIHTMFCVVHGHGTYLYPALCDVDKLGASMTLECLYRTVFATISEMSAKYGHAKVRNIYISLDNTVASNKNWTVMRGCAMLMSLGICEKVKVIFPLLGHTKGEADKVMGVLQSGLAHQTFLTISAWRKAILEYVDNSRGATFHIKVKMC